MFKQFYLLLVVIFIGFVGISLPYAIFGPLFLQPENYSFLPLETPQTTRIILLGITLALYPLGLFIGSPVLGAFSDRFGRKRVMLISIFLAALGCFLTGISLSIGSLSLLLVTRCITGISEGNIAIARAMAQDFSKSGGPSLHSGLGKINAAASIAYVIGPLIGGVFSTVDVAVPFYVISAVTCATGLFAVRNLRETKEEQSKSLEHSKVVTTAKAVMTALNPLSYILRIYKMPNLKNILICSTLFTLSVDAFYQFYPVYLAELRFSPFMIAVLNGFLSFALAIGNGWLPEILQKRFQSKSVITIGSLLFSVWLFMLSFETALPVLFLLLTLAGLALSSVTVSYTVELSNRAEDSIQGEVFGVLMGIRTLFDAIICIAGTVLMLTTTSTPLFIASFVVLVSVARFISGARKEAKAVI